MSKPINPLDGDNLWKNIPDWAYIVMRELGHFSENEPISLDDQFKPWCRLTEDHQQALKDACDDSYQIWFWEASRGEWWQVAGYPGWFGGSIYAVGELREDLREEMPDLIEKSANTQT